MQPPATIRARQNHTSRSNPTDHIHRQRRVRRIRHSIPQPVPFPIRNHLMQHTSQNPPLLDMRRIMRGRRSARTRLTRQSRARRDRGRDLAHADAVIRADDRAVDFDLRSDCCRKRRRDECSHGKRVTRAVGQCFAIGDCADACGCIGR